MAAINLANPHTMSRIRICVKNHFSKMKMDIGMANYEKQGKQETAYPIPISYILSYYTVVQRYRDGVCSLLFFLTFHPYIPLYFGEMILFHLFLAVNQGGGGGEGAKKQ